MRTKERKKKQPLLLIFSLLVIDGMEFLAGWPRVIMIMTNITLITQLVIQFIKFTGIGIIGTIFHYALLIFLVQSITANPVWASTCGASLGALINYILNYHYTFYSKKLHREAMPKYFLLALMGLAINTLVMSLEIKLLGLHYLVAQIIATGIVLLWNFTGNKLWTFKENVICQNQKHY